MKEAEAEKIEKLLGEEKAEEKKETRVYYYHRLPQGWLYLRFANYF